MPASVDAMTLILNEIYGRGSDRPPLMVAAADRRVTNPDGSYNSSRRKLFPVARIAGAVSYFGIAAFTQGTTQVFLSDWLPRFIRNSQTNTISDFAEELRAGLNSVVSPALLRIQPSGFHVCGFDLYGRPDFWFVSNVGAMQGFAYTDLRSSYLEPASHFLGRDAMALGFDVETGRGPEGRVQIYRNGDVRVHAVASEAIDTALSALGQFPDFRLPRTPIEYESYVRFKFEVISYIYKNWARRQIVARPIDALVLEAPRAA